MALAAIHSKAVVLLLIYHILLLPLFVGALWSLYCYAVLSILSSFAIIFHCLLNCFPGAL